MKSGVIIRAEKRSSSRDLSTRIIYYICIVFSAAMMIVTPTEQRMMIFLTDAAKNQGN